MKICRIFMFTIVMIVFAGCSTASKTVSISPTKLDFGSVNLGSSKDLEFEIKNKLGEPVDITRIEILDSTDFVIISNCTTPMTLIKNETIAITIKFIPMTDGEENGLFVIEYGDSMKIREADLVGIGRPVPIIGISHNSFDFGTRLINTVHTHDFDITNTGTKDLSVSNMSFTGIGSTAYRIAGSTYLTVAQGQTETVTIEFEPPVVGQYPANLEIIHDAENESVPLIFSLDGEGVLINPEITLNQLDPWDFGTIPVNYSAMQTLELENTGSDPLDITTITMQTSTEFVIDTIKDTKGNVVTTPINVLVGDKIFIYVAFSPTAKITYNDSLKFVHNATNKPQPFELKLTGIGRDLMSQTFTYTGAVDTFQLPAGVTTIIVEIWGAEGGDSYPPGNQNDPGKGGKVSATLTVPPGSLLEINVGGKGDPASSTAGGYGGWNRGGKGGTFSALQWFGGGGGGASDIRVGGSDFTDRIIVAGSGGGGGGIVNGNYGGDGGGLTGKDGMLLGGPDPQYCGGGGSQIAGGAAGTGGGSCDPGALGVGGDVSGIDLMGGGGGAGYYGGGAGSYGGGGGGSSYTNSTATNVVHDQGVKTGNGEVKISY